MNRLCIPVLIVGLAGWMVGTVQAVEPVERTQDNEVDHKASARATAEATAEAADKAGQADEDADELAAARTKALEEGWPDTPAGIMASRWVDAFSMGEEAMRDFLEASLNEESLAKRPMQERLEKAEALRRQIGGLMLTDVQESEEHRVVATLLSDSGAKHTFVFQLTEESPARLESISMMHPGGHGGHSSKH